MQSRTRPRILHVIWTLVQSTSKESCCHPWQRTNHDSVMLCNLKASPLFSSSWQLKTDDHTISVRSEANYLEYFKHQNLKSSPLGPLTNFSSSSSSQLPRHALRTPRLNSEQLSPPPSALGTQIPYGTASSIRMTSMKPFDHLMFDQIVFLASDIFKMVHLYLRNQYVHDTNSSTGVRGNDGPLTPLPRVVRYLGTDTSLLLSFVPSLVPERRLESPRPLTNTFSFQETSKKSP